MKFKLYDEDGKEVKTIDPRSPVNRGRRASFVFGIVAVCIATSVVMAFFGAGTDIQSLVAGKLLDLSQLLSISYVGASAFDYSIGGNVFKKKE